MQILLKNFQLTIYNLFYFNWILKNRKKLRIIIGLYLKNILDVKKDFTQLSVLDILNNKNFKNF